MDLTSVNSPPHEVKFKASARWIWDGGPDKPVDAYRLFRKQFTLKQTPRKALMKITADAEYRLFVNGTYVGRGPAPNPPAHISVDSIDISGHLTTGPNCIGVIVFHLGIPSFPRMLGRAGLIAELDADKTVIITDDSWKCHEAWWSPSGQRYSIFREFTEILDGRNEPDGWNGPGFDDNKWLSAVPIGPSGTAPWANPETRDIPQPEHHTTMPARILFSGSSPSFGFGPKEASQVLAKAPEGTVPAGGIRGGQISAFGIGDLDSTIRTLTICMDFGREVSGYPEIIAAAASDGVIVDLGYGEGLEKDGHVSVRRQGNPSCDRLILRKGTQKLRIFHHRAFRYLVLAIHGGRVHLEAPRVIESGYPNKDRGSFSCSDPKLTRIWEVGRHTMRICMDQGFMDCPWRERGQYIGDGLAEGPVALYAFGDTALMRRFLRQAKLCQPADGLLEPAYPCDWTTWHGNRGPNRIPGYGLLWVVMLDQYYRNTGDIELVRELGPTLDRLLAWFEPHRAPNGLLHDISEWNFIDWVKLEPPAGHACLNLQYLMALRSAEALDKACGRSSKRGREADRVAASLESTHWDDARGLYRDAPGQYSVHTNALALLTFVNDAMRAKRIIDQLHAPDLVKPESPYFEGFVLRALCKHGRQDEALRIIRENWGHMIDEGATTFWEGYSMGTSLCHAWSCTPTALLSEEVLGVRYDAASKAVTFAPHSVGLKWAKGIAPMKCGDVTVSWKVSDNDLKATITTPKEVMVKLDSHAMEFGGLVVDGKKSSKDVTLTGGLHNFVWSTL